jgi:hypothetical protein
MFRWQRAMPKPWAGGPVGAKARTPTCPSSNASGARLPGAHETFELASQQ